jgi:hypothetical protein
MSKYWLVGANFSGDDMFDTFVRRGYWFLGWDDKDKPSQAADRDQIQVDDRIAIKRKLGQGSPNIEIRAIGIVTEIDPEDKRVYVQWVNAKLQRQVPSKGCFASIHGPFIAEDEWIRQIFQL